MYDHSKQYRCTIIRGKSQSEMDNLLPAYSKIINEVCPCSATEFVVNFNRKLASYLPMGTTEKTLNNHRTEIAGVLFGMYYESLDGTVFESERTQKFLEENDQPAFFKDFCYKMQFPNGMTNTNELLRRIHDGISCRPYAYLLSVLSMLEKENIALVKHEVGYYILNSYDVLASRAMPDEVVAQVVSDRKFRIHRSFRTTGKATSYDYQHINEMLNYLELANLVIISNDVVRLNQREGIAIKTISESWNLKPTFDVYSYDLASVEMRRKFYCDWSYHFSLMSEKVLSDTFRTSVYALTSDTDQPEHPNKSDTDGQSLIELGDEGEEFVLNYEKSRVYKFDPRLVNKVLGLGRTKGLGYDIQSVEADGSAESEFVKYIEVKSTKRVTIPDLSDINWLDSVTITRNEWVAAMQHKRSYSIYRVYFARDSVVIYVLKNIHSKDQEGKIKILPLTYRLDFDKNAIDQVI